MTAATIQRVNTSDSIHNTQPTSAFHPPAMTTRYAMYPRPLVIFLQVALLLAPGLAFSPSSRSSSLSFSLRDQQPSSILPRPSELGYARGPQDPMDRLEGAEPLPLSKMDLERLSELKTRGMTLPIVILDALVPGQKLFFQSPDPKFEEMIKYVLSSTDCNEIGIVGLNPHTGQPLNMGVTAPVDKKDLTFGLTRNSERVLATSFKGQKRFVVVGEPWMDATRSFYIANVEVVDNRHEVMPDELAGEALRIFDAIPKLVQEWIESLIKSEKATPAAISEMLKEIGPMPSAQKDRAIWVSALVNPIIPLKVCAEIRPAMLACRNNHDRLVLASTALLSSIDNLSGEKSDK